MILMECQSITKEFGGLKAINNVSLKIENDTIFGLIGPNGAGKTTLFNIITGTHLPSSGIVRFQDRIINGVSPFNIVIAGIARTFQISRHFVNRSVLDNIIAGRHCRTKSGFLRNIIKSKSVKEEFNGSRKKALEIIHFLGLDEYTDMVVSSIPQSMQRRVDIGIALATEPKLLLLDEPGAGLNEEESARLLDLIKTIRNKGITVVLIEHDMDIVMNVCERIFVLNHGTKIAEGAPKQIQENNAVIEAYLGVGDYKNVTIE